MRQRRVKSDYKPWLTDQIKNYVIKEIFSRNKLLNLDLQHMIGVIRGIRIMLADL